MTKSIYSYSSPQLGTDARIFLDLLPDLINAILSNSNGRPVSSTRDLPAQSLKGTYMGKIVFACIYS